MDADYGNFRNVKLVLPFQKTGGVIPALSLQ